jgi:hypothetical protein
VAQKAKYRIKIVNTAKQSVAATCKICTSTHPIEKSCWCATCKHATTLSITSYANASWDPCTCSSISAQSISCSVKKCKDIMVWFANLPKRYDFIWLLLK